MPNFNPAGSFSGLAAAVQATAAVQDNKENANVATMQALVAASKPKKATKKRMSSRRRKSYAANANKTGVEDIPLCTPEDQQFTTEFAFFVTSHLKKCYLTKEGGSRSSPAGFPGLACGHCAGEMDM